MSNLIKLSENDNVATVTQNIRSGEDGATTKVPTGHKMALADIEVGETVIKYSETIGYARQFIPKGAHVHDHNLDFKDLFSTYEFSTNLQQSKMPFTRDTFYGFKRKNGRVGTRNTIAI